jgi:Holliday junction resolvase-like predicted endonuclease
MPNTSIEQLQNMISELILSQKETENLFKETAIQFKETDTRFKETEKILNQKYSEIWDMFKDTDKQIKETDKQIKEANALFTSQWGKLIESLVKGDLVNILKNRGIDVHDTSERRKGNHEGENYEFDIIAHNGTEIVIVEVKTTLRVNDVKSFLSKLSKAKLWLAEYKNFKIYGAIAYLKAEEASDIMAMNNGLFSIRATGNSAAITNAADFVPVTF